MPPKKTVAPVSATGDEAALAKEQAVREGINIEDLSLPKSIVTRLAKGALPPNTQIQGNAMLAMTKSATVFVNYLASHANEHAQQQNRKTLSVADVFAVLEELEFPDWRERLEGELAKYNEILSDKRNVSKKKAADSKAEGDEDQGDADGQPVAKKARLGSGTGRRGVPEREGTGEEDGNEDEAQEDDDDEEEEEEEGDERLEGEEQLEDTPNMEAEVEEDEALDNGEDSD